MLADRFSELGDTNSERFWRFAATVSNDCWHWCDAAVVSWDYSMLDIVFDGLGSTTPGLGSFGAPPLDLPCTVLAKSVENAFARLRIGWEKLNG